MADHISQLLRYSTRWVPLVVVVTVLATLLLVPLKIAGNGYQPPDDCLRHCAKIIAAKPWPEILVLRPEIRMDTHPGWHLILGWVHRVTDINLDGLVFFSVVSLFILLVMVPVPLLRRPEALPLALLVLCVANFGMVERLLLGRPYLLELTVVVLWGFLWPRFSEPSWPRLPSIILFLAVTLATWCHGTWYLLVLLILSTGLARQWLATWRLSVCLASGIIAGAVLTGHPLIYLRQAVDFLFLAVGLPARAAMLVSEFQPFMGELGVVCAVALFVIYRRVANLQPTFTTRDPVFLLMLIGWVLGFKYRRFWFDWGEPALIVWLCLQIQDILETTVPAPSWRRANLALAGCLALYLAITADTGGRWSNSLTTQRLSLQNPEHAALLPEAGGILYSDSMAVFYDTFFENPQAPWRYMLGFEPGFMPPADLHVYRRLQETHYAFAEYQPWVAKMTTKDRLVLVAPAGSTPYIAGLEWHWVNPNYWIGIRKTAGQRTLP